MLSRYLTIFALAIAALSLYSAYSQRSALVLRDEQRRGGTRYGTTSSGYYRGGVWVSSPDRQTYGSFQGGGPGAGK